MVVTRRGHPGAHVQRKNYRIDVVKVERTDSRHANGDRDALDLVADEAALILALRQFVHKGGGHGTAYRSGP